MCGRAFLTYGAEELVARYLGPDDWASLPELRNSYNFAPTQEAPIVLGVGATGSKKRIITSRWQLVPPWEPEFKTKLSTINAKSETVFQSKLYRSAVLARRCIFPISGFYEWKKDLSGKKRPYAIRLKDKRIMSIAAIWSPWKKPGGAPGAAERTSFALLTTSTNSALSPIHDRMPVILRAEDEDAWLDPANRDPARLARLLKPCPSEWLETFEVSTRVNSPRNNDPELLAMIQPPLTPNRA
jgi:putative SOS response-associated peptidase YedK